VMPEPAQIPANASPGHLASFPPQQVLDYMKGRGKPVLTDIPATPAEAAAKPALEVVKPQVKVIPAPEPEFSSDVYAASARAVKANKLANLLHEHGIPYEDAKLMGEPEWAQLSQAAGVKVPSAESVKLTLFELKKLGRKSNLAQMPARAQAAAEALGDLGTGDSPAEIAATPVKEIAKRRVRTKK